MRGYYFQTKSGTAAVVFAQGSWHTVFAGEDLGGGYQTAQSAADDLVGGYTFTPSSGIDTSRLGIPVDVADWEWSPR